MKTIGILTTIQGHKSIAQAIHQTLTPEYEVVVFSETDILFKIYSLFYKYVPFLFAGPFIVGSNRRVLNLARSIFYKRYIKAVNKFDKKNKIDLFINTFWMYEGVLEELSRTSGRPLLNVLADPRSFHPTSIGLPPALNLLFDEAAIERCQKYYPSSRGVVTGWFVRPEFEAKYDVDKVRTALKLPLNQPIVLFVTGSEGMEEVIRMIKKLEVTQEATLIVACGLNHQLFEKIRKLATQLTHSTPKLKIIPLPFTTEIGKYMQAADLLVGKAGPNMLFESVACLTPFMATNHVAGQEDGNLEIIREHKLGYVEENVGRAAMLLSRILAHPEQLDGFQPYLKKMAERNSNAKQLLKKLVAEQLAT